MSGDDLVRPYVSSFCSVGFEADPGDPPLKKGYVRLYEFLHGFEDIPIEQWEQMQEAAKNDPLYQLLLEEVTKEINREVIRTIEDKIRVKDVQRDR
jgi:hypothetical protein